LDKIETYLDSSPGARVVHRPFRILAAMLLIAALIAFVGSSYLALKRHDLKFALFAVSFLPIAALLVRSAGNAVLFGRVVRTPLWPFASGRVASVWVVLMLFVTQYA
jgi:hypothetical protein